MWVVASINSAGQVLSYYGKDMGHSDFYPNVEKAIVYQSEVEARISQGRRQALFPEFEIVKIKADVTFALPSIASEATESNSTTTSTSSFRELPSEALVVPPISSLASADTIPTKVSVSSEKAAKEVVPTTLQPPSSAEAKEAVPITLQPPSSAEAKGASSMTTKSADFTR